MKAILIRKQKGPYKKFFGHTFGCVLLSNMASLKIEGVYVDFRFEDIFVVDFQTEFRILSQGEYKTVHFQALQNYAIANKVNLSTVMNIDEQTDEKELFKLIEKTGETLDGDLHILEIPDDDSDNTNFKVYHRFGYCFDISKKPEYDGETGDQTGYYYEFFSGWDGFEELTARGAIDLVQNAVELNKKLKS